MQTREEELKKGGFDIDFDAICLRGGLTGQEKLVLKWHGVYESRKPGSYMARILIPGGILPASKAKTVCELADRYGKGMMNLTVRGSLQLHHLRLEELSPLMGELKRAGLSTFHGCGDVIRGIPACPLAETCRYRRFDVRDAAKKSAVFLNSCRDLDNLPRKFKITFSGCSAGCAQPWMNCAGLVAVLRQEKGQIREGYQINIGGGMGWKGFTAQTLFTFIPSGLVEKVCRALVLLFRDNGDRTDRARSRMKFVVERLGIEECRRLVLEYLAAEGVDSSGFLTEPFADAGIPVPLHPLAEPDPVGTDGKITAGIIVPKGEITVRSMQRIIGLSEKFGQGRLILTNRQDLLIPGVAPDKSGQLKQALTDEGFSSAGLWGLRDPATCAGSAHCSKALSDTRSLHDRISTILADRRYDAVASEITVNITGCQNGCSPYRIAGIGFRGTRFKRNGATLEGFELHLGGSELNHGKKIGDFTREEGSAALERILNAWLADRREGEDFSHFTGRIGTETLSGIATGAPVKNSQG